VAAWLSRHKNSRVPGFVLTQQRTKSQWGRPTYALARDDGAAKANGHATDNPFATPPEGGNPTEVEI
jgi:hypothetical protein